jgi:hypothetical protein
MSKHTPGPWKVIASGDGSFAIEDHAEVYIIAQRNSWPSRIPESQANASLLAAAPELLAACKEVYEWMNRLPIPTEGCLPKMQVLHDAITRAEPRP